METLKVKVERHSSSKATLGGLATLALIVGSLSYPNVSYVYAEEGQLPYKPGVSIGVPVGALPPPGLYYSTAAQEFQLDVKNNQGKNIGVRASATTVDNQFLYVPDIPQIFGATYGAFIDESPSAARLGTSGGTFTNFGLVNTVISPINLSWNLHNGFFVSLGLTAYPPAPNYRVTDVAQFGRGYSSIEPGMGISYLANGFNFSLHPVFDFNTVNPHNGYKSGNIFSLDYTAMYSLQKISFGIGGSLAAQVGNDSINGVVVAAVPGINSHGNRALLFNFGPVIGYDFGPAALKLYYNRTIYAANTAGGNLFYLRLDVPIFSGNAAKAARNDTGGTR